MIAYALLVVSGGAVRLTGSGLGCPDWPSCYQHHLTAVSSFHPMVEFLNRLVTVAVTVLSGAALVVTALRTPFRKDLALLGGGLVLGIFAQIVLGGLVVLFKLNPYLVALHFVLTIVVLAAAIALFHRACHNPTQAETVVGRELVWLARLVLASLTVVTFAGTVVTGSGPHAGGPGAKRIPIAFRTIAEVHATLALFTIGLTLAAAFAFWAAKAPSEVQGRARLLIEVMAVQGGLGYLQYFLHDAAFVVELHLAGVTTLWIVAVGLYLSLHRHPQPTETHEEPASRKAPASVGVPG